MTATILPVRNRMNKMLEPPLIASLMVAALLAAVVMVAIPTPGRAANPETRAVWVTRWEYTSGGTYPSTHKYNIRRMMDRAVKGHFNVIVLQVRGQGDAYYQSNYEPWAYELTGGVSDLGTDPGWDPLQYAIEQAHQRGLELHAWLNTFTCWRGNVAPPQGIIPEHIYHAHPEWICADRNGVPQTLVANDYVSVSPGVPAVRAHVHNVAMDILERYDVDGIHFDYIRYPHAEYSRDAISDSLFFEEFGFPPDDDTEAWKDWQRDQVTTFVQNFYYAAMAVKPMVKVSAAVIGRYNVSSSGWDAYNTVYQDARLWASRGIMDYLAPMIYWDMDEFAPLIEDWTHYSYGRHVYAGIAAYKSDDFGGWSEIEAQIDTARIAGAEGLLFFRSGSLDRSNGYYWTQLGQNRFRDPATVAPMWWKDPIPPEAPGNLQIVTGEEQHTLTWEAPPPATDGDGAQYYGVYRTTGAAVDVDDPGQLLSLTAGTQTECIDSTAQPEVTYRYAVVAYDKGDNESAPSDEVITAVEASGSDRLPSTPVLRQNYPNPFNALTTIEFELSESAPSVSLDIFNVLGQRVVILLDEALGPGRYRLTWDGTDRTGNRVASGIYFCRLQAGDWSQTKRIVLIR
jgi:uncharacterized lipoprotein YddW (UPF0748 family)